MTNRKSNAAIKVKTTMLDEAASLLGELPEKPELTISLRQAIEMLQSDLRASLEKGYDYEELAEILTEQEIEISPSTLKRYLAMSQRSAEHSPKPRRSRTSKANGSANGSQNASELEAIAG